MANNDLTGLNAELTRLRESGLTLPKHPGRALHGYKEAYDNAKAIGRTASSDLRNIGVKLGRPVSADNYDSPEVQRIIHENNALSTAMGNKRATSRRFQKQASGVGGDVYNAITRFYHPLEYWDTSGLPWNVEDEGHRHKLHKWLRLYYATHYLVPILVDIFTRFPLVGMELDSKDS